jgi:hypothetical protein
LGKAVAFNIKREGRLYPLQCPGGLGQMQAEVPAGMEMRELGLLLAWVGLGPAAAPGCESRDRRK